MNKIDLNSLSRKILFLTLLLALTSSHAQDLKQARKDSLSKIGEGTGNGTPLLYIVDGLVLSAKKYETLAISYREVRRYKSIDSHIAEQQFGDLARNGVIKVSLDKKIILNGNELSDRKKRIEILQKINEKDITEIRNLNSEQLMNELNINSKYGALIIKIAPN